MANSKKKEPRMITGVLLLTLAGMAEKILGVIFKIPLAPFAKSKFEQACIRCSKFRFFLILMDIFLLPFLLSCFKKSTYYLV